MRYASLAMLPLLLLASTQTTIPTASNLLSQTVRVSRLDGGGGSGTVIYSRPAGVGSQTRAYILTAAHIANIQSQLKVERFDYQGHSISGIQSLRATVLKSDRNADLALIEVVSWVKWNPVKLISPEDYAKLEIGEQATICGCPLSDTPVITQGLFSKFELTRLYFTAPIIFGNSGGPCVDSQGRLVGIVTGVATVNHTYPVCHLGQGVSGDLIYNWLKWSGYWFIVEGKKIY